MTSALALRDYQQECISYTDLALKTHSRVANVLPTGSGKSFIFAHMARRHIEAGGSRVLILTHTDELADQALAEVKGVSPELEVGLVKATSDETGARVVVGGVQTLARRERRERLKDVSLVIVDECELFLAPTFRKVIEHFTSVRDQICSFCLGHGHAHSSRMHTSAVCKPCGSRGKVSSCKVVGFTATLMRGDDGDLSQLWQTVAYRRDILWMIRQRYLIDVKAVAVKVADLDLKSVKRSGGDFQKGDLGQALSDSMAPEVVARALREHRPSRQTMCFVPLVATAYEFAKAFEAEGFTAEVVHGELPKRERKAILARYDRGETQVLVNAMVLTRGFNAPKTSCVIVARPTKSKPLFQQMVGRGLRVDRDRPYEEQDCLVLIVAGAESHDLRSLVDLSEKRIDPRDGQTLLEAEDEAEEKEAAGALQRKPRWTGPVKYKEVDLLMRASRRTWGTTREGVRYLAAGDFYIVLLEAAHPDAPVGSWDVLWVAKRTKQQGRTNHVSIPIDMAMDWGEDEANRLGADALILNTKGKSWRSKKDLTPAAMKMARGLGIEIPDGMRRGELSDAIDQKLASRRIDPMARTYRAWLEKRDQG